MNEQIQAKLAEITAPFQASIDAANAIPALVDAEVAAKEEAAYKRGQDSIVLPAPTLPDGTPDPALKYTQKEMDDAFAKAHAENDEEVAALKLQIEQLTADKAALQVEVDGMPSKISDANAAYKAEVTKKIENFEANEDQSMRDLLASI